VVVLAEADDLDVLDDHIEVQVHGPLRLKGDIEALVLDPSYRGTDVEAAAAELPVPICWHHGFRLQVDPLAEHGDYRDEDVVRAGRQVAEDGWLDARIIGDAVRAGCYDAQTLKRLWHCTTRYGHTWSGR
jgi:hypothetical protein